MGGHAKETDAEAEFANLWNLKIGTTSEKKPKN